MNSKAWSASLRLPLVAGIGFAASTVFATPVSAQPNQPESQPASPPLEVSEVPSVATHVEIPRDGLEAKPVFDEEFGEETGYELVEERVSETRTVQIERGEANPAPIFEEGEFDDDYAHAFGAWGQIEFIDGLGISNAGVGGKKDIATYGGGISFTFPAGSRQVDLAVYGLTGDSSGPAARTGVDSLGRTFVQFDGQTQFVPPGLNVTDSFIVSDYDELGARVALGARGTPFTIFGGPNVGLRPSLGFALIDRDEQLRTEYGGINFFIDERREVDTTRFDAGAELDLGLFRPDSPRAFVRLLARARLNLDSADGKGTYHTAQSGNFDETVTADLSRTALTFTFAAEASAGVEVAEGVTFFVSGSAGRIPIWSIEPREGSQAQLEHDMHTQFGARAGIEIGW